MCARYFNFEGEMFQKAKKVKLAVEKFIQSLEVLLTTYDIECKPLIGNSRRYR